jgi:hypothetical protein
MHVAVVAAWWMPVPTIVALCGECDGSYTCSSITPKVALAIMLAVSPAVVERLKRPDRTLVALVSTSEAAGGPVKGQ